MVYLSFGIISCSIGISFFHDSIDFITIPFLVRALSITLITLSTARNRFRWRAFWNFESLHGIFHKSPPIRELVGLNEPNMFVVTCHSLTKLTERTNSGRAVSGVIWLRNKSFKLLFKWCSLLQLQSRVTKIGRASCRERV